MQKEGAPTCASNCSTQCQHTRCMQRLVIPREIIWLNGPPGSGKGANLGFVKRIRGLSRSITMSAMLERNPEAQAIIRQGGLVPDEVVGDALLQQVSIPERAFFQPKRVSNVLTVSRVGADACALHRGT